MELLRTEPLYIQIYNNLRKMILNQELKPNDRLVDSKIAKEFNVSRSPVREALRKLEQDGLVININGVISVYSPSLYDVIELYKVRAGLEHVSVYWATKYISEDSLQKVRIILEETEKAIESNDTKQIIYLNTLFHDEILKASKNDRLIDMMNDIKDLIYLYRQLLIENHDFKYDFILDHKKIYTEMERRDQDAAATNMKRHIFNDMNHFKQIFNKLNRRGD